MIYKRLLFFIIFTLSFSSQAKLIDAKSFNLSLSSREKIAKNRFINEINPIYASSNSILTIPHIFVDNSLTYGAELKLKNGDDLTFTLDKLWHAIEATPYFETTYDSLSRTVDIPKVEVGNERFHVVMQTQDNHNFSVTFIEHIETVLPPGECVLTQKDQAMLDAVNNARSMTRFCGETEYIATQAVKWNCNLGKAAQLHIYDMIQNNFYSHVSSDGSSFSTRLREAGYSGYSTLGENIFKGPQTVESAMRGWLNSPGHCRNIMNSRFKDMGSAFGADENYYGNTFWVQDFGG